MHGGRRRQTAALSSCKFHFLHRWQCLSLLPTRLCFVVTPGTGGREQPPGRAQHIPRGELTDSLKNSQFSPSCPVLGYLYCCYDGLPKLSLLPCLTRAQQWVKAAWTPGLHLGEDLPPHTFGKRPLALLVSWRYKPTPIKDLSPSTPSEYWRQHNIKRHHMGRG